jgi:hypothetical protein
VPDYIFWGNDEGGRLKVEGGRLKVEGRRGISDSLNN